MPLFLKCLLLPYMTTLQCIFHAALPSSSPPTSGAQGIIEEPDEICPVTRRLSAERKYPLEPERRGQALFVISESSSTVSWPTVIPIGCISDLVADSQSLVHLAFCADGTTVAFSGAEYNFLVKLQASDTGIVIAVFVTIPRNIFLEATASANWSFTRESSKGRHAELHKCIDTYSLDLNNSNCNNISSGFQ